MGVQVVDFGEVSQAKLGDCLVVSLEFQLKFLSFSSSFV